MLLLWLYINEYWKMFALCPNFFYLGLSIIFFNSTALIFLTRYYWCFKLELQCEVFLVGQRLRSKEFQIKSRTRFSLKWYENIFFFFFLRRKWYEKHEACLSNSYNSQHYHVNIIEVEHACPLEKWFYHILLELISLNVSPKDEFMKMLFS